MIRQNSLMKRTGVALILCLLLGAGSARADQTTSNVQQALKEQGFYYGDLSGKKTSETTAAIRRYQIRNGLQITGEIDAETLRSLGIGSGVARSTARAQRNPAPEETEEGEEEPATQSAEIDRQPPPTRYDEREPLVDSSHGRGLASAPRPLNASGVFVGTPYALAPADVQRHVIVGAQTLLTRFGYYRSGIDGQFGPGTATALRRFQTRMRLLPNGRLNMPTLAALGLLPGQRLSGRASSGVWRGRPVYRGEWISGR